MTSRARNGIFARLAPRQGGTGESDGLTVTGSQVRSDGSDGLFRHTHSCAHACMRICARMIRHLSVTAVTVRFGLGSSYPSLSPSLGCHCRHWFGSPWVARLVRGFQWKARLATLATWLLTVNRSQVQSVCHVSAIRGGWFPFGYQWFTGSAVSGKGFGLGCLECSAGCTVLSAWDWFVMSLLGDKGIR